jgi:hypothetical protein
MTRGFILEEELSGTAKQRLRAGVNTKQLAFQALEAIYTNTVSPMDSIRHLTDIRDHIDELVESLGYEVQEHTHAVGRRAEASARRTGGV